MKKLLLASVATLATVSAFSALAADLLTRKAPLPVMTVSPWQGVYAGINAGYGLNNITTYRNEFSYQSGSFSGSQANSGDAVEYIAGGVAGAQLGYNHVFANHWMLGAEVDFDWADIYNNANPNQSNSNYASNSYNTSFASSTKNYSRLGLDWIGTVRARIGYDMGRFLPYITGGFAYGGLSYTLNFMQLAAVSGAPSTATFINGTSSTVGVGWAAGAGAEYLVTDNWSLKGEYLFTSIGGINTPVYTIQASNGLSASGVGSGTSSTGSFGVHQIRAGLNYHTNWWGAAPVVAAY